MSEDIKVESCPQCGAPVKFGTSRCQYCGAEFIVSSLGYLDRFDETSIGRYIDHYKKLLKDDPDNGELNCAMGICYLDLGLHDQAVKFFSKAIEQLPDYGDAYYYYALALVNGKRPRVLSLAEIRKIEEYVNAAIRIDNSKAKYYCLLAIIKYDFYLKNGLRMNPPTLEELIEEYDSREYDSREIDKMLQRVPVDDEEILSTIRDNVKTGKS